MKCLFAYHRGRKSPLQNARKFKRVFTLAFAGGTQTAINRRDEECKKLYTRGTKKLQGAYPITSKCKPKTEDGASKGRSKSEGTRRSKKA